MCLELIGDSKEAHGTVASSLSVDGLPREAALAVCFGPGEHRVRVLSRSVSERSLSPPLRVKAQPGLWDDGFAIKPLTNYRGKSRNLSLQLRQYLSEVNEARMCW